MAGLSSALPTPATPGTVPLIVVINDEADICQDAARALEEKGFQVIVFSSTTTALESPALQTASLILTDCHNRNLSGRDFWNILRSQGAGNRVAFLSAHADDMAEQLTGEDQAPAAYFALPCSYRSMAQDISALVHG